jgi:hypothetical protein
MRNFKFCAYIGMIQFRIKPLKYIFEHLDDHIITETAL